MTGITKNDMMAALLNHLASAWVRRQKKAGMPPCYSYYFKHSLPGDELGAWHACDLRYAFGTLEGSWRPFTETDEIISGIMVKAIANFAANGNPNGESVPEWLPGRKVLSLDEKPLMIRRPFFTLLKNTVFNDGPM